jgi:hypothetical protein
MAGREASEVERRGVDDSATRRGSVYRRTIARGARVIAPGRSVSALNSKRQKRRMVLMSLLLLAEGGASEERRMDNPKLLYALANGLGRITFLGDTSLSREVLKTELLPDVAQTGERASEMDLKRREERSAHPSRGRV